MRIRASRSDGLHLIGRHHLHVFLWWRGHKKIGPFRNPFYARIIR